MSTTHPPVSESADLYRRLAHRFTSRVEAVPPDRWNAPSPCEGWSARDVLRHVVETETDMVARVDLAVPPGPSVDDDPVAAWKHAHHAIQQLLDDPENANREYHGMLGRSTLAEAFASFYACDLVVHGWDIAHATGIDESIQPDDIQLVRAFIDNMSDDMRTMMRSPGAFGPEVDPPADANEQTKVLAFLGRRA